MGQRLPRTFGLCCFQCNTFKAVNVAGYDPETDQLSELFHPRQAAWEEHFECRDGSILGKTVVGRTTVDVLRLNLPERVEFRRLLAELGVLTG